MSLRENWPPPSRIREELAEMKKKGEIPTGLTRQEKKDFVRGEIRQREQEYLDRTAM